MRSSGEAHPKRDQLPAFELEFRFDDADDPRNVTIYHDDVAAATTAWITMSAEHAVSLEDVA